MLEEIKKKAELYKTKKQLLIEANRETNKRLSEVVSALERFTNRVEEDQRKVVIDTKAQYNIVQNSIPTESDIDKIVQERLEKERKEAEYNIWYNQLSSEVKDDLRWVEGYFKCDKFVAKEFWVQLLVRFQNRAAQESGNKSDEQQIEENPTKKYQ